MKKTSIKVNAVLNTIQILMSMMFPLITFPYASRVLSVESIGKYNFSNSIISYFTLLAGLGIPTYAIREGARIRDNDLKLNCFVRDVFSINVYSTLIAYIFLVSIVFFSDLLHPYWKLIAILSMQIIFATIGRSWIYTIFEDYLFITVRTIFFQILNLILLFLIVREPGDVDKYAVVSVFGLIGNNMVNMICSEKYCRLSFTWKPSLNHIMPIILIFSTSVSIVIYGSSDITMLGVFGTDYNVGLYSISAKIYTIIKQLVAAILTVTIPRFSYYLGIGKKEEFKKLFSQVFNILCFILLPISAGLCMLSRQCIFIISGPKYMEASLSLSILSIAMIFNLFAYMLGYSVLIPNRKEKYFFTATAISAIVNIMLNYALIPKYMQNATAVTTLIAEGIAAIICFLFAYPYIKDIRLERNIVLSGVGTMTIIIICIVVQHIIKDNILSLVICVIASILMYMTIHIIFKNPIIYEALSTIKVKLEKQR